MTCRHSPGDPACSSHPSNVARRAAESADYRAKKAIEEAEAKVAELMARTPNPEVFEVVETEQVGNHLVMMVKYTSCEKCSHDAKKVMVYGSVTLKDAIKWKVIDPHFAEDESVDEKHAPAPIARFPANKAGWDNALMFAKMIRSQE